MVKVGSADEVAQQNVDGSAAHAANAGPLNAGPMRTKPAKARPRGTTPPATKVIGDQAEDRALAHLLRQGLSLECRNYRLAAGPSRRAAEIDLILRERDGTLVFCEVRTRRSALHGGAAASVSHQKQHRIVRAASLYLLRFNSAPPCRFDVVAIDGDDLTWLRGAFET